LRKFLITDKVFELFPKARVCGLVIEKMDNGIAWDGAAMLEEARGEAAARLDNVVFAESPFFAPWRQAFKAFGAPRGYRSSVEALAKRATKGGCPPSINPLVDLYNVASLKFLFPCGAEDLDAVAGDVRLTAARGGEPFLPLGGDENDPPREGEIAYLDNAGAICRCWNWREADRTKLTQKTGRALLCMENLLPERDDEMQNALNFMDAVVTQNLGAVTRQFWLDSERRQVELI